MTTFLYIMQTDLYFKVGITSTSIFKRMKQVQTGCPTPIRNIHYYPYPLKQHALDAEKFIHNSFKKYHTFGEWFKEFNRYISISESMLNIKFQKIELDINTDMIDYKNRYIRKIKKAKNIFDLELIRDELLSLSADYFMDNDKEVLISMINHKSDSSFDFNTGRKIIARKIRKPKVEEYEEPRIEENNINTNNSENFSYNELQKLIKKLKYNKKEVQLDNKAKGIKMKKDEINN